MAKKKLRVGFDLDGVLLYNPARVARPLVAVFKRYILQKKKTKFFIPKSKPQKMFWMFLHYSSFIPASGLDEIRKLAHNDQIEAYIITGRFSFLERDFMRWVKRINGKSNHFKEVYLNKKNEQPHLFKKRMIEELDLDVFVEDNWNIVQQLRQQKSKVKVLWIYNVFDRHIDYEYKFPDLKKAVEYIKKCVS